MKSKTIFRCDCCRAERQYGETLTPETNHHPVIRCADNCQGKDVPTPHTFIRANQIAGYGSN